MSRLLSSSSPTAVLLSSRDDSTQPLSVITIDADDSVSSTPLATDDAKRKLSLFDQIRLALGVPAKDAQQGEMATQ
jgi:hypothetical protein